MVKRNIIANFSGRVWTNLLGLIFVPLYLNFLGAAAYGLVGFFATITSITGLLDFGIGATMTRELARLSATDGTAQKQRDLVRTLEIIYWGLATIAGGAVVLAAPVITKSWLNIQGFPIQEACDSIQLMGVALALQFPLSLYQGGLMGLQKQIHVNIILVVTATIRGFGAVLLLWLFYADIRLFFLWQIIVSAISTTASLVVLHLSLPKSDRPPVFRLSMLKELWRFAAAVSGNGFIGAILTQMDKVILSKMLTLEMFGYYTIASTAASSVWSIIIPFMTAIFPQLVQLNEQKDPEKLSEFFHKASQALSVLLFPVCMVLVFFSKKILILWTSRPDLAEYAYSIVSILVLGTMLNGMAAMPGYAAMAFGWPQMITYTNAVQVFMIVPLMWFLASRYGGEGAAIAWLVLNSTYILVMTPFFFRRYLRKKKWEWYLKDQMAPLLVVCVPVLAFSLAMPEELSKPYVIAWLTLTWLVAMTTITLSTRHVRHALWALLPCRSYCLLSGSGLQKLVKGIYK